MESEGKAQWAQKVALLNTTTAEGRVLAEMDNGLAGVAGLHPGSNRGDSLADLGEHGPRLMLLKALVKSNKTVQQWLGMKEDSREETLWTIASHPPLTPTPSWRGVSVAKAWERELRVKPDRWRLGP